jgi:hypothetical protein
MPNELEDQASDDARAAALAEAVSDAEQLLAGLDGAVNGNRVARHEVTRAIELVGARLGANAASELRHVDEAFRRAAVMLAEDDRVQLRAVAKRIRDLVLDGARSDQYRGRRRSGTATARSSENEAQLAGLSEDVAHGDLIDVVGVILRGVVHGMRRWTWESSRDGRHAIRWEVLNERHVQNLLWLALAPSVPGLRYESYVPGSAHYQPRADFTVPEHELVIEVKFVRAHTDFSRVVNEIAADSQLYAGSTHSAYSRLVVFVWDDSASPERHTGLAEDLRQIRGVLDVVIASRPGMMGLHVT